MKIIGWDVGGVNIKAALVEIENEKIESFKIQSKFYPMWLKEREKLPEILSEIYSTMILAKPDLIAITMTAELSDAFYTKREGINHILNSFKKVFPEKNCHVLTVNGNFISISKAIHAPLLVAASNWVATCYLVGHYVPNCILIDIGSTTTDIIPIIKGKIATESKTDLDRLIAGELAYTGSLRATIPSIVRTVEIKGKPCRISFEKFALVADAHLILGNITRDEYKCDTADGRDNDLENSYARLARVVCADIEMFSKEEIENIAEEIYEKQLEQIKDGLIQVTQKYKITPDMDFPVVVTGLGKDFLARKAAEDLSYKKIIDFDSLIGGEGALVAPSISIAKMLYDSLNKNQK
ncbi:MAG: H4MPT-linked C1 transfer pathway protein [Candidatus Helarchaeota archaeon]|nr:H4MPT-linked C1 transfer pathway protein [Candidatus Helarchaeota archaeon]